MRAFANGLPVPTPSQPFVLSGAYFYDQEPVDQALSYLEVYGNLISTNFPGLGADSGAIGALAANTIAANEIVATDTIVVGTVDSGFVPTAPYVQLAVDANDPTASIVVQGQETNNADTRLTVCNISSGGASGSNAGTIGTTAVDTWTLYGVAV